MELASSLVKEFAKQAVEAQNETITPAIQLVGTVSIESGQTYVTIDGSQGNKTPVENTTKYSNGDRVLVTIQNRTATIIGNYTEPSINEALGNVSVEYALSSSDSSFVAWPGTKGQWSTTAPSRETGSYMWQRTTKVSTNGGTPVVSMTCIQGADGSGGADGLNSATVYLYQRASSAPSKPSSTLTYTFATGILSGTLGNWKQSIAELSGTNPIYVILATAISDTATDTIASSEWSNPTIMAQNGEQGKSVSNITEQWARGTESAADSSSWSASQPTLTTSYPILWYRMKIDWTNPTSTTYVPSSSGQKSTMINELVTFRNTIANPGYTTINGGKIGAGTITLGGTANGDGLLEVKDASNNLVAKLSKDENIFAGFKVKAGYGIKGFGDTGDLQESYWRLDHDKYVFDYYFEQVPSIQFAQYTFGSEKFYDSFDGWYQSENKGMSNTAALDVIHLYLSSPTHVYMDVVDYNNESRYDYGTVGIVDGEALDATSAYSTTGANVKWTGYNNHVQGGQTIDFGIVSSGEHNIWIRYIKDSSQDNENDRLYFRIYTGKEDALFYENDSGSLMYISNTRMYQRRIIATTDGDMISYSVYKTLIRNASTEIEMAESDYVSVSTKEIPLSSSKRQTYIYGGEIEFAGDTSNGGINYYGSQEEDFFGFSSEIKVYADIGATGSYWNLNNGLVRASHTYTTTVASGSTETFSKTISKAGYYPLGVVGYGISNGDGSGSSYARIHNCRLSAASVGSATLYYGIRADSGKVSSCTFVAHILWAKVKEMY